MIHSEQVNSKVQFPAIQYSRVSSEMQQKVFSRNTTRGFQQKCNKGVSPEMQQKKGFFRNATKGSLQKCNK
jgi:hypothetical protein